MRQSGKIAAVVVASMVFLGALAGGARALTAERAAAPAAGTATPTAQEQAARPASADQPERAVVAKGALVPAQHASLGLASGGIVAEVLAKEGDKVGAGQLLLRLQNDRQRGALAEAQAGVAAAQARLDSVNAGARPEEVAAAQAAVDAANAGLQRLQETARPEDVAAARSALDAAQANLKHLYDGPDEDARIAAAADVANAQAAVRNAQAAYDKVKGDPNIAMLAQSLQLEQATNALNAAQGRYDQLMAPPTADRVAQAQAQVKQAQANLDRLAQPATAAQIAEAQAAVRQAQAQLDLLKAGAREQDVAAAGAAVAQAQAAQQQAQAALADTELHAPFGGTLAAVNVRAGEQAAPGVPMVEIGDIGAWQVETDDLSELDVVRVQPGKQVSITFDAIPGLSLPGTVQRVQPKGEKKLGDMTYTAMVQVDQPDSRLMWNMTAVVHLTQ